METLLAKQGNLIMVRDMELDGLAVRLESHLDERISSILPSIAKAVAAGGMSIDRGGIVRPHAHLAPVICRLTRTHSIPFLRI